MKWRAHPLRKHRRTATGTAITEGAVALVLIVLVTIPGVIMLINSILMTAYRQKVAFVANEAATFAASRYVWSGFDMPCPNKDLVNAETQSRVNRMLKVLGLPEGRASVTYKPNITTVTVSVDSVNLMAGVPYLPTSVSISETGAAINSGDIPPALLAINIGHSTKVQDNLSVLVPCYGRNVGAGGFSPASSITPGADKHPHQGTNFNFNTHSDMCLRAFVSPTRVGGGSNLQVREAGKPYGADVVQWSTQFP